MKNQNLSTELQIEKTVIFKPTMKSRSMCISLSRRTQELPEKIDEYADIFGMTKAATLNHIVYDWERLKMKEQFREWEVMK